jgi:hypothetical protein
MPSNTRSITAIVLECAVKEFSGLVDRKGLRHEKTS